MASSSRICGGFLVLALLLLSSVPGAEALDTGDAVAILLGMAITVVGFCACLGWYARSRSGRL
ncbi:small integral membrane protein 30-like [Brienomyrus brachyistius]|uniref:small integral membrane protein 30-like n=1 Tax=Brienomyrus brachyistius TaxID=42636 RepID=UPI0020B23197|nr:small integral membrane protein 30-like [Brienomyrus brachyistius]